MSVRWSPDCVLKVQTAAARTTGTCIQAPHQRVHRAAGTMWPRRQRLQAAPHAAVFMVRNYIIQQTTKTIYKIICFVIEMLRFLI